MRRSGLLSGFATPKMLDMLGCLVLGIGMMQPPLAAMFRWLRVDRVGSWRSGRALPFERCDTRLYARTTRATTPEMLFERMAEGRHRKACWRSLIEVFGMYAGVVQECFYPAFFIFVSQLLLCGEAAMKKSAGPSSPMPKVE